jgi:regulator of protease activity HflC (stomatin/prohibitin superfamily)
MDILGWAIAGGVAVLSFLVFFKLLRIVPEQQAWVIEFFGKFQKILGPGFHMVIPGFQKVAYKQILKEEVIDVAPQVCITKDNVQVTVDGILYLKVMDPEKASYGIDNYRFATAQLAQTTMRSEIGKLNLDATFSERDALNNEIVKAVDEASDPWGIKVTRYEIKDITPTGTVIEAMEAQVRAERDKRAEILSSEGEKESQINVSKGVRQESINMSEGEKQKRISESEGKAESIKIIAEASAEGIRMIAEAIRRPNGDKALNLRLAEQYVQQLQDIISQAETAVMPHDLAQLNSIISTLLPGNNAAPKGGK